MVASVAAVAIAALALVVASVAAVAIAADCAALDLVVESIAEAAIAADCADAAEPNDSYADAVADNALESVKYFLVPSGTSEVVSEDKEDCIAIFLFIISVDIAVFMAVDLPDASVETLLSV